MTEGQEIEVRSVRGRPMLNWVGKRPLRHVTSYPAQHVEAYNAAGSSGGDQGWTDWPEAYAQEGLLFHGDNKEVLAHLLANGFRGKADLIYIDPPFDSGANYVRKVRLRGGPSRMELPGETYAIGEQVQYGDIWNNDGYLQWMYERLLLLKEFLTDNGSICLHVDEHKGHHLRCLLDEVFGGDAFVNEIVWHYPDNFQGNVRGFANNHSSILWYARGGDYVVNKIRVQLEKPTKRDRRRWDKTTRRLVAERDAEGNIIYDTYTHRTVDDVWRIGQTCVSKKASAEYTGYPTQKPEEVVGRIVEACSNPGDLVLDCFVGSGTTAAVAQKLGRRWIGCDMNKGSIQTTSKRLQSIMKEQAQVEREGPHVGLDVGENVSPPCQLSFSVWRVNDYDLQIPHSEVVALACEHIGMTRNRSDGFFDGTCGKQLVRVLPFTRPLSPIDLEEVSRELQARPEETRDILLVCLGKELAADAWLEDWNRLRRQDRALNRIDVIELRTDPKYGGFMKHKPAEARVRIAREDAQIVVTVEDFCSPSIISRLQQLASVVQPQIDDWRAMVDCVMIDTTYDGEVFDIALADVPETRDELVAGHYELPVPAGKTTVAVKIVDMLGEEVLVTERT